MPVSSHFQKSAGAVAAGIPNHLGVSLPGELAALAGTCRTLAVEGAVPPRQRPVHVTIPRRQRRLSWGDRAIARLVNGHHPELLVERRQSRPAHFYSPKNPQLAESPGKCRKSPWQPPRDRWRRFYRSPLPRLLCRRLSPPLAVAVPL